MEFIKYLARLEGLILDPVYTGKAMYALVNEIKKGTLSQYQNILFIHTGGLFGLFPNPISWMNRAKSKNPYFYFKEVG